MRKCWAYALGDCGSKLSREHILSAALWDGPAIQVVGLPWCKDEPKTVGLNSVTARILCTHHNTALSGVDEAGAKAFRTLQRAADLQTKRSKSRPRRWKVIRYEIDGGWLERWFLKTLINIVFRADSNGTWALHDRPLTEPPELLVRAAFGHEALQKPLGLYTVAMIGEDIVFRSAVEAVTLLTPSAGLVGALFHFRGVRFLLYLDIEPLPARLPLPSHDGWVTSAALYHLNRMNWRVAGKMSHYVRFLWGLP